MSRRGTHFKTFFTIGLAARYGLAMVLLAALVLIASDPPRMGEWRPANAVVQARATVRIISGTRIRFTGEPERDMPAPRASTIRSDGLVQPAKLVEFE